MELSNEQIYGLILSSIAIAIILGIIIYVLVKTQKEINHLKELREN
jgi:hypothetical protein